jgi:hypothetical protein
MERRLEILIIVLVALGAAAVGAGAAVHCVYPVQTSQLGRAVHSYLMTLNAPPDTVTTEMNRLNLVYKGTGTARLSDWAAPLNA